MLRNLLGAAEGALIRAAASTQPFGGSVARVTGMGSDVPSKGGDEVAMKLLFLTMLSLAFCVEGLAQNAAGETAVRQAVKSFYTAFDNGFTGEIKFATNDWNHINPYGGWARGRENVLKEVREVHTTFLKGVSDTVEDMSVRFATRDVAVVTVTSVMSTFVTPDGVKHENERHIRTFVVVKRGSRWLVMQDQNTAIGGQR